MPVRSCIRAEGKCRLCQLQLSVAEGYSEDRSRTIFYQDGTVFHSSIFLVINLGVGEEVVTALGSEVDRLEKEIQNVVPGIRHVDIEAHNPIEVTLSSESFQ
ncbi:Metal tolerance protein C4 [Spatholobus suberectus]|nr:Metal tolerance protein C4 [Spatholobus suberectus]